MANTDDPNNTNLDKDLQDAFLAILKEVELDCDYVRKQQIKYWRRAEEYWSSIQNIFWNEIEQDWRVPTQMDLGRLNSTGESGETFYDYVVNIYKAHGQSLGSALNAAIPTVIFFPKDADQPKDLLTAKTYSKVSKLIQKHNKAKILLLKIWFYLYNHGNAYVYNYSKADEEFGTEKVPVWGMADKQVEPDVQACPNCGASLTNNNTMMLGEESAAPSINPSLQNPSLPQSTTGGLNAAQVGGPVQDTSLISGLAPQPAPVPDLSLLTPQVPCPQCQQMVTPTTIPGRMEQRPSIIGYKDLPVSREMLDVYGGLHVKIPYFIRKIEDAGYLLLSTEEHYAKMKAEYTEIAAKIDETMTSSEDKYDRWMRTPLVYLPGYRGTEQRKEITRRVLWLRPWMYETVKDDTKKAKMIATFPEGCRVTFVGDIYAEARSEKLVDHWTVVPSDISTYIHTDAVGNVIINLQDIKNNMTNLAVETVEHGIPWTTADPQVFDFEAYANQEALPGMVIPTKEARPGQPLENSFYTAKTAQLTQEVGALINQIKSDAEFVLGDFPSMYGGMQQGGSKTASEYLQSKNQAMQRLTIIWTLICSAWSNVMKNAVQEFIDSMIADVRFTERVEGDNFVTVWIRQEDAKGGEIDCVEPEASETFPISATQSREMFLNLINLNNPEIMKLIFSPENQKLLSETLNMPELNIPGENQRIKQLNEFKELLNGVSAQDFDPMTGAPVLIPSVPTEPEVDDDLVHGEVLSSLLCSPIGWDAKVNKPEGYKNAIAHLVQHQQNLMRKMQNQQGPPQQQQEPRPKLVKGAQ